MILSTSVLRWGVDGEQSGKVGILSHFSPRYEPFVILYLVRISEKCRTK